MDKREQIARILTQGGDHVLPTARVTRQDGRINYTFDGPLKPMWQHDHYLEMADEILSTLGINNA